MRNPVKKFIARTPNDIKKELYYLFNASNPKRVLFDHLHKCGGSSLNKYLEAHYPRRKIFSTNGRKPELSIEKFKSFSTAKRHGYELVRGHLANQLIDYIHPDHLKVTVLRNPVDRIVSLYYYAKESPKHYLYPKIHGAKMSLEDFTNSGMSDELKNRFVTHFSGLTTSDVEKSPEKAVDTALEVLMSYDVIGFLECFSFFTDELRLKAGLRHPYQNKKVNVTNKRASIDEVAQSAIDIIAENNYLDIELYKRAKASFGQ